MDCLQLRTSSRVLPDPPKSRPMFRSAAKSLSVRIPRLVISPTAWLQKQVTDSSTCDFEFSVTPSAKGGIKIQIGSHVLPVPEHSSVRRDPLLQMVLYARQVFGHTFACLKSLVPKSILDGTVIKSRSSSSRNVFKHLGLDIDNVGLQINDNRLYFQDMVQISTTKELSSSICSTSQPGGKAGSNSERTGPFTHSGCNHQRDADSIKAEHGIDAVERKGPAAWFATTGAAHHAKGNQDLITEHNDVADGVMTSDPDSRRAENGINAVERNKPATWFAATGVQSNDNRFYSQGTALISTTKELRSSVCSTSQPGGIHARKKIFMLSSRPGSGGSNSEITGLSTNTGGNHHRGSELPSNDNPVVILDSQAQANCTGTFKFSCLQMPKKNIVLRAANGQKMKTIMSGSVRFGRFQLNDVHYCPDLGNIIIVSGSELDKLGYSYTFGRGKCSVTDLRTGSVVGEGRLVDGDYIMDYLNIPHGRTPVPEDSEGTSAGTSMWEVIGSALRRLSGQK